MIKAKDIMHPEDEKAIAALKKVPCIDEMCRSTMEIAYERIYRGENLGMMVKVDNDIPELCADIRSVANSIGIKTPELYIYNDPVMNAYTYGETDPFVCISSSLLEKMNQDERKAILAHECGHILCHHVLYGSVAFTLKQFGEDLGFIGETLTGPVQMAFRYWSRRSELSADRCAAAVVGEETFQMSMLKLAMGLVNVGSDPYRLVRQAKEYHAHEKHDIWSRIQQNCRVAFNTHPQYVNRAYEIDRWKNSATYKRIRQSLTN